MVNRNLHLPNAIEAICNSKCQTLSFHNHAVVYFCGWCVRTDMKVTYTHVQGIRKLALTEKMGVEIDGCICGFGPLTTSTPYRGPLFWWTEICTCPTTLMHTSLSHNCCRFSNKFCTCNHQIGIGKLYRIIAEVSLIVHFSTLCVGCVDAVWSYRLII